MFGLQKSGQGMTVPPAHYSNSPTKLNTLMDSNSSTLFID